MGDGRVLYVIEERFADGAWDVCGRVYESRELAEEECARLAALRGGFTYRVVEYVPRPDAEVEVSDE